jgi:hypothetical protein
VLEPEGDVFEHRHVRPDRIGLEDHRHAAPFRRQRVARLGQGSSAHDDAAGARLHEAGDQAKRRRLAAARGTEKADQLALADRQIDRIEHGG